MRRIFFWACVFAFPCAALAQSSQAVTQWENLGTLHPGQKIQVIDTSHKKHSGAFASFSDQAVKIEEKNETETIQKADVSNVSVPGQHRLRNVLLLGGLGAGVGAGIGAGAGSNKNTIGGRGPMAAFCGAIGLVGGAVVGALLPSHKTIYRANP
jgi:hypothetical protein